MNSDQDKSLHINRSQGKITTQNPELLSFLQEVAPRPQYHSSEIRNTNLKRTPETQEALPENPMSYRILQNENKDIERTENPETDIKELPEQSAGSPVRSRGQTSRVGRDKHNRHSGKGSQEEHFIDSLELDTKSPERNPTQSQGRPNGHRSPGELEESLEIKGPEFGEHLSLEQDEGLSIKAASVHSIKTKDNLLVDSNVRKSYSTQRLKGSDKTQRQLLPTPILSESVPRESESIYKEKQDTYRFSETDTAPIRELLKDTPSAAAPHADVDTRGKSAVTYTVPKKEIVSTKPADSNKNSMEDKEQFFVDSPTFTTQEEEEYRFVNSRLDDAEDFKDNATYRELDRNALKNDKDIDYSSMHRGGSQTSSAKKPRFVLRPSSKKPDVGKVKETNRRRSHPESLEGLAADSLEISTEDSELERELEYQKELQDRLAQQVLTDADIRIPRLNLPAESVEYGVRDSLDDDTYRDTEKADDDDNYVSEDNGEWVNPPNNQYYHSNQYHYPPPPNELSQNYTQQSYPQQNYHQPHPYQQQPSGQPQGFDPNQQIDYGYASNVLQTNYSQPHPQFYSHPNTYAPDPPNVQVYGEDPSKYESLNEEIYDRVKDVYDPNSGQYNSQLPNYPTDEENPQGGLVRYPTQTEADYFIELPQEDDHETPRSKQVNYIEKNRENVLRGREGKSYGDLNKKKSEVLLKQSGMNSQNSVRKTPAKKNKESRIDDQEDKPIPSDQNAENVWKNRSANLANSKQRSGKARSRKIGKLSKYPTESKIEPRGFKENPSAKVVENETVQRATLSTGDLSPSRRPLVLKPITQEVWTEDGQRISVDINLKLMSPPPAGGPGSLGNQHSPQRPIPQDGNFQDSQFQGPLFVPQQPMFAHSGFVPILHSGPVNSNLNVQQYPDNMYDQGFPVQGDYDKFKKHQHNVEQQQFLQEQIYQQQLAKKQQLQQQLHMLQLQDQYPAEYEQTQYQGYIEDSDMYDGAYPSPRDHVPTGNQGTPRYQKHQPYYNRPTADVNPYQRIPPISTHTGHRDPTQPKESPQGYVNQYFERKQKEQRKPDYKVYTIDDYRKMQKEVRLGGLGPDLDSETYRDKAVKKVRQENYAREVMMRNRQTVVAKPPSYPKDQQDLLPKSHVAKEYSRNIPKPKVRPVENQFNSYQVAANMSPAAQRKQLSSTRNSPGPVKLPPTPTKNIDVIDLQKLHERHQRDKQNASLIRHNREIL